MPSGLYIPYWTVQADPRPKSFPIFTKDSLFMGSKTLIQFPEIVVIPSVPTWIPSFKNLRPSFPNSEYTLACKSDSSSYSISSFKFFRIGILNLTTWNIIKLRRWDNYSISPIIKKRKIRLRKVPFFKSISVTANEQTVIIR